MEYLILLIAVGFLYLFLKPKKSIHKSKAQKQAEILRDYQEQMENELSGLDEDEMKKRTMILLKKFADELNRNLFFNEEETKRLIQKLINGK